MILRVSTMRCCAASSRRASARGPRTKSLPALSRDPPGGVVAAEERGLRRRLERVEAQAQRVRLQAPTSAEGTSAFFARRRAHFQEPLSGMEECEHVGGRTCAPRGASAVMRTAFFWEEGRDRTSQISIGPLSPRRECVIAEGLSDEARFAFFADNSDLVFDCFTGTQKAAGRSRGCPNAPVAGRGDRT